MKYKRRTKEKTWNQKVEMGGSSEWLQRNDFCPNGLVVEEAVSISRPLDSRRWAKAEERTAELISRIQPTWLSEMHRNAVASYVQRLVSTCVPCQVFTFGSVPLKTYLPDGDIDLSAFSEDPNLKDNWAKEVQNMLLMEEKNKQAEFPVKEVQLIQAEVKIIKCLVDNIVVDISFNQLGGLCTLCFLEEIDHKISKNHLFKRSIILIKAWCYYESRILGAHHGLISTYALETLVLYIFHVFNNSFDGPLEVLYRFLEFFSKFDWANFCLSLRGPVPIRSLPNMAAAPPRKDGGGLLLSKVFLDSCGVAYSVFPAVPENRETPFMSKHLNVIDPLRLNNNLGRSVNKGNFYRIRSAFSLGAQQLAKILERPVEDIVPELNRFFMNTWERHGKGCRPDAPILDFSSNAPEIDESQSHHSLVHSAQPNTFPLLPTVRANLSPPKQDDQYHMERRKLWKKQHDDIKRTCRMNTLHTNGHTTHHFARTSSSPELTSMSVSSDGASNYRRNVAKVKMGDDPSSRSGNSRRMIDSEARVNNAPPIRESSSRHSLASGSDHSSVNCVPSSSTAVVSSVHESRHRFVEEQDLQKKISSNGFQQYGGLAQMPVNLASHPFPPSIMGYSHPNYAATIPTNVSSAESDWGTTINYPSDPFSVPLHQQLRPIQVVAEHDKMFRLDGRTVLQEADHIDEHTGFWIDSNGHSNVEFDPESEDVCSTSSRLMPASPSTSSRTQASSESSWDGKPSKSTCLSRYPVGKKSSSTRNSGFTVNRRWEEDEETVIYTCDRQKDWVTTCPVEVNQMPRFGRPQMISQNSMSPYGSLLVHPGSHQGVVPVAFYPAGPHVPFVTVVPIFHIPPETGSSGGPSSHNNIEKEQLSLTEYYDSKNMIASREHAEESASDIFNSDFANHWKNLQYGRLCQDSQLRYPFLYHPAVLVPPQPVQGTSSLVSPGRSSSITHAVPVSAPQSGSVKPVGISRRYGGTVPKQRNGTGTYFPNPNIIKDRQSSTPRQYRWDYSHERSDIDTDREPNWNSNSKPRYNGRAQPRNY